MRLLLELSLFLGLANIYSMPCQHPITIRSVRPIGLSKSGRIGCPGGAHYIQVPCGKCDYCKRVKLDGIVQRLEFEFMNTFQTLFITYTYDDDHVHLNLSKDDAKTLLSDLKNVLNRHYGKFCTERYFTPAGKVRLRPILYESFKYKYFLVGEYGEKRGRVHMHMLLFLPKSVDWKYIQKANRFGYICDIQVAGSGCLHYVAEYCVKSLVSPDNEQYNGKSDPFYLQSNGIGACMVDSRLSRALHLNMSYNYRDAKGFLHTLPKYLRNKVFDYFERQQISDEIADIAKSKIPHSFGDRNTRLDNLERIQSHKISKVQKHYKSSLL